MSLEQNKEIPGDQGLSASEKFARMRARQVQILQGVYENMTPATIMEFLNTHFSPTVKQKDQHEQAEELRLATEEKKKTEQSLGDFLIGLVEEVGAAERRARNWRNRRNAKTWVQGRPVSVEAKADQDAHRKKVSNLHDALHGDSQEKTDDSLHPTPSGSNSALPPFLANRASGSIFLDNGKDNSGSNSVETPETEQNQASGDQPFWDRDHW